MMRSITLEQLPPDMLVRVLIALDGVSTKDFSSAIDISYRTVLDVSKGTIPCGHKLLYALALKYNLDLNLLILSANEYNTRFRSYGGF